MRDEKRVLVLDRYDHKIIMLALNEKRNELLKEQKPTNAVDDVLLKTIDAPVKRLFKKKDKIKSETR